MTLQFVLGVQLFSQILGNTIQTVLKATDAARKFRIKMDLTFQYLEMRNVRSSHRLKELSGSYLLCHRILYKTYLLHFDYS